jgi:hypothetical protein
MRILGQVTQSLADINQQLGAVLEELRKVTALLERQQQTPVA